MGEHSVSNKLHSDQLRVFSSALLDDVRAMEEMLENNWFDEGPRHIGAEQEIFLVDKNMLPSPIAVELLESLNDERFTTEIARYNIEVNLQPLLFSDRCLSTLEEDLNEAINLTRKHASKFDADILLAGILPTLQKKHLDLSYMTPSSRYESLNNSIIQMRGNEDLSLYIKGLDELHCSHDNVMLEACNTSFQMHLQVTPSEFAGHYNWSQAIIGPLMSIACNSPFLFGKRLWHETRIALFQQSVESRSQVQRERNNFTRVYYGSDWVEESVLELFKENVTRFRILLTKELEEKSSEQVAKDIVPKLQALCLQNGTIWRWNRPCYGSTNPPHLRIESRPLPSGPSIIDEVANMALFLGLMVALPKQIGDVRDKMSFKDTKKNFYEASRTGLSTNFVWLDGKKVSAPELLSKELIPLARQGLESASINTQDIEKYMSVLEERLDRKQTGASWMLDTWKELPRKESEAIKLKTLTQRMLNNQKFGEPSAQWEVSSVEEKTDFISKYQTVSQLMTTDLFTLRPDDLIDMAASIMDWRHIRHIPVEDEKGRLQGIISHRSIIRFFSENQDKQLSVQSVMKKDPVVVTPDTSILEAINQLRQHNVGCLPVVENGLLVGIVTAQDFLELAGTLIEEQYLDS